MFNVGYCKQGVLCSMWDTVNKAFCVQCGILSTRRSVFNVGYCKQGVLCSMWDTVNKAFCVQCGIL